MLLAALTVSGGKTVRAARIYAFVLSGLLACLPIGCAQAIDLVISASLPVVDLSGASTEKTNLVNFCNCITGIERETDEGELQQIWPTTEREAAHFVLSPGMYRVRSSEYFRKVGTLSGTFKLDAKAGHQYAMLSTYCTAAFAGWLFLEFSCPLDAFYAGFHRLKDETTGDIIGEASIGYD